MFSNSEENCTACISAPFVFSVTSPCCPVFSFGLLAFPIFELKSPTNSTSRCLLHLSRSTATFPKFRCIPFTALFYSGGICMFPNKNISLPAPPVPLSICFRRMLWLWSRLLCHTRILWLGTLLPPPPYSSYRVPSSFSLSMRTLQLYTSVHPRAVS